MANEVTVCNMALNQLGDLKITSLEDNSTQAKLCKVNYDTVRDCVLEERSWTFATRRHTSETAEEPEFGMGFKHAIPAEYLKVTRVFSSATSFDPNEWRDSLGWRREGDFIIAREAVVYMWGTQKVTNTNAFSALFIMAFATRMAVEMCIALTENQQLLGAKWAEYGAKIAEASSSDGSQGDNDVIQTNAIVEARNRRGFR